MFLLFLAPFSWGTQKREAAAPKASGCFMGGTCAVREEPGKQKPRSCRAQELARSRAQENARQKKSTCRNQLELGRVADFEPGARRKRGQKRKTMYRNITHTPAASAQHLPLGKAALAWKIRE